MERKNYFSAPSIARGIMLLVLLLCITNSCTEYEDEEKYNETYYDHFLIIRNYRGNMQNVHPKVLFFPERLFGHRYWMAYSPYPQGNPKYENPCVAFSEDGINWQNIKGNPLDIPENTIRRYNSDPHLLFNAQTGLLELWFRFADENTQEETIYRMTSDNGQDWTPKQPLMENKTGKSCALFLSPAAYYEDGRYRIWAVNSISSTINYYESTDGTAWQFVRSIDLNYQHEGKNFFPWHIDVIYAENLYRLCIMVKEKSSGNTWCIFYSESADNEHWSTPIPMLLPRQGYWDEQLYRSSLVQTDQGYTLYYSARKQKHYGIGILRTDSLTPPAFEWY